MLTRKNIDKNQTVAAIVSEDYRAADVFRKYNIEFCCGGKYPLQMACDIQGVPVDDLVRELESAVREVNTSQSLDFNGWHIDFLTDYIVNVHHHYLRKALPGLREYVERFADGHRKKYPYLDELQQVVVQMQRSFIPHLEQEEDVIFPYIRQISHAYNSREPYASLLVRTLRKPVEEVMAHEHETTAVFLQRMRTLTSGYQTPENACLNHRVTFHKLREMDNDIVQHLHLENNILFPKAIAMEKELLAKRD